MQISKNMVVTLDYTLKGDNGEVIDATEGRGDFVYLHGAANIIPGLENALEGKAVGDNISVTIAPDMGYGERNDTMIQKVSRDMFQSDMPIEVGMQFHAQSPDGQMIVVTVAEIADDEVTVDGNHPLAGETLHFDVDVREIREALAEEIEHGHVHGPEGHEH